MTDKIFSFGKFTVLTVRLEILSPPDPPPSVCDTLMDLMDLAPPEAASEIKKLGRRLRSALSSPKVPPLCLYTLMEVDDAGGAHTDACGGRWTYRLRRRCRR